MAEKINNFTRGPWVMVPSSHTDDLCDIKSEGENSSLITIHRGPNATADAMLICAARHLLAACKAYLADWDQDFGDTREANPSLALARYAVRLAEQPFSAAPGENNPKG